MYDENYLYILVEVSKTTTLLVILRNLGTTMTLISIGTGTNSKGSSYDGVDDFHIMIPLFQRGNTCSEYNYNGRMRNGSNSAAISQGDHLQYATGLIPDSQVYFYENKIGLKNAGIRANRTFGIDVHIDDDDDGGGGGRDQKWGVEASITSRF